MIFHCVHKRLPDLLIKFFPQSYRSYHQQQNSTLSLSTGMISRQYAVSNATGSAWLGYGQTSLCLRLQTTILAYWCLLRA